MKERTAGRRRVLIVEDEMLLAMLVQDMLEELGHEVVGPEAQLDSALRSAQQSAIDAALLDLNLHGRETYPVAEALQQRGIPFVFSTGYGAGGVAQRFQGIPVLTKPFQSHDLARALDLAWSGYSEIR